MGARHLAHPVLAGRAERFRAECSQRSAHGGTLGLKNNMAPITTLHYLVLAAALFILGVIGVLTRRNVVIILMSIELILNAVNLNLVAFSRLWGLHGQVFSIFVITDAAAEAAVGLGILIAFFRNKETVNVDEVDLLKG
jgi:NADH-quinone oxidoreductase subunit K